MSNGKNSYPRTLILGIKKASRCEADSGPDGTRTRDPLRDRQVF